MAKVDLQLPVELQNELAKAREKRNFQAEKWVEAKLEMFDEYLVRCGLSGAVVSVSGGVDSAVIYALALRAKARQGSALKRVVGVAQPIASTASIWQRALELRTLADDAEIVVVDQTDLFRALNERVAVAVGVESGQFASGQLKSYMRTPVGFFAAQLLSQAGHPAVVLGTGNYDEDGYLRYFCKAGDGVVDVQLIADLHKSEVFQVGRLLGVPESILSAPPSADLWEGQTDEEELGFSYDFVELLLEVLALSAEDQAAFRGRLSADALSWFDHRANLAASVHRRNAHKAHFPVNLNILPTLSD